MSRRPAGPGDSRVAIVGASTDPGTRLREALGERGVSGTRVDLYGTSRGEALLSEYAGEARMIQQPDPEEIASHDVIFLCERGKLAVGVARVGARTGLIVDVIDCLPATLRPPRSGPGLLPGSTEVPANGILIVPHPLAIVLAELLAPLDRRPGLAEVVVVGIRPASDFGEAGVEELREQTVKLLSFAAMPTATFGRQLAFNVIPESRLAGRQSGLEDRIRDEAGGLLGWQDNRIAVRLVTAGMFHGHAFQARLRPVRKATLSEVQEVLDEAGTLGLGADAPCTPFEITGEARTTVSDLSEDGLGAFWLWAVAGETASRGARHAVDLAVRAGRL